MYKKSSHIYIPSHWIESKVCMNHVKTILKKFVFFENQCKKLHIHWEWFEHDVWEKLENKEQKRDKQITTPIIEKRMNKNNDKKRKINEREEEENKDDDKYFFSDIEKDGIKENKIEKTKEKKSHDKILSESNSAITIIIIIIDFEPDPFLISTEEDMNMEMMIIIIIDHWALPFLEKENKEMIKDIQFTITTMTFKMQAVIIEKVTIIKNSLNHIRIHLTTAPSPLVVTAIVIADIKDGANCTTTKKNCSDKDNRNGTISSFNEGK